MESYLNENYSGQDDSVRSEIRSELSKMTFEDVLKLKQEIGNKVYKEAMFGPKSQQTKFKRENKNRPQEVSSKVKPDFKKKVKANRINDPRFDRLCGTFNEKHFQNVYGFLTDIRKKEKVILKNMLKKEKDLKEATKIKYLVQRIENQEREELKRHKKQEIKEKERQKQIEALKSGKKPHFRTKYEKKIFDIVNEYSDLKATGKLEKYIKKKQNLKGKKCKTF